MAQSILNVRVNSQDKKDFEEFCTETGMNISVCVNMFIKAVLRDKRLPFEVKTSEQSDPFYSEANVRELDRRIADLRARRNCSEHELIEVD